MNFKIIIYWLKRVVIFFCQLSIISFVRIRNRNFEDIDAIDIQGKDKLFILGTGSSINNLSKDKLEYLRSKNFLTIGLNGWVYHSFIPDIYAIEFGRFFNQIDDPIINMAIHKSISKKDNPPVLLINQGLKYSNLKRYRFRDCKKIVTYSHIRLNDSSKESYQKSLFFLMNFLHRIPRIISRNFLLGTGSSLERIVSLGIIFGFKEIVLLGIDLSGPHFYDKEPGEGKKLIHRTNDPKYRKLIIQEMMTEYKKIANKHNIKIFSQSESSPLAKIFPVYKWD